MQYRVNEQSVAFIWGLQSNNTSSSLIIKFSINSLKLLENLQNVSELHTGEVIEKICKCGQKMFFPLQSLKNFQLNFLGFNQQSENFVL